MHSTSLTVAHCLEAEQRAHRARQVLDGCTGIAAVTVPLPRISMLQSVTRCEPAPYDTSGQQAPSTARGAGSGTCSRRTWQRAHRPMAFFPATEQSSWWRPQPGRRKLSSPCQAAAGENGVATEAERREAAYGGDEESQQAILCDSGLPDHDVCDVLPVAPREVRVASEAWSRGRWLLGLLVLQSMSSFVLESYEALLREHLVVTVFLTMLVGAGGNAGNQSAIKVIRGLATGSIPATRPALVRILQQQATVGLLLAVGLSAGGFARVYITNGSLANSSAIGLSLFMIVMASVLSGTVLPFALTRAGIDPANAGTSIQVLMDILGCFITCATCHFVFDQLAAGLLPLPT